MPRLTNLSDLYKPAAAVSGAKSANTGSAASKPKAPQGKSANMFYTNTPNSGTIVPRFNNISAYNKAIEEGNKTLDDLAHRQFQAMLKNDVPAMNALEKQYKELGNIPAPYVPRKLLYICPPPEDIAAQTVMTYGSDKCEVWSDGRIIYIHEDSIHEDNNPEMEHANFIDEGPFSFLEASTGTALMDNLEQAYSMRYFKALLKQGGVIWCAMDNALLKLDADTADIVGQYAFGDAVSDMKPAYLYMDEDAAYVVFEGDGGALLYGFDPANGEYREIAAFDSKKVLLHITDGRIYRAQGREIICSALDEMGIAGDIFRIKLPRNIVADNIFETAGDWLFVYRDSPKANTETNRLLYKINLNTQAVIAADE